MTSLLQLARAEHLPEILGDLSELAVYPRSVAATDQALYFMGRQGKTKKLGIIVEADAPKGFDLAAATVRWQGGTFILGFGDLSPANARALRQRLPFTAPSPVGACKSVGLGDRLGIATPGHIRAMRHGQGIMPVFAQQSIREMERTMRTPLQVIDSATWGVFQEGWRDGYGADADHLKTRQDIDVCAAVGFVMYTLDPREHVDNEAENDDLTTLGTKYEALPWERLESSAQSTVAAYADRTWELADHQRLTITEAHLLRAASKYGWALAHLVDLYRYLSGVMGERPFELEISVDETDTPTRPEEHFYIASELKRLGVAWVSMAPRYIGRFEKGVDYVGDLSAFEASFARHVAIARTLGPYKLSLHSGSDKFSIYPIAARLAGDLVHLKTAGTSYLEALRAVARVDPTLFRDILTFAIEHYETDRASYHVSAELDKVPDPATVSDSSLPAILDEFDTRQVFHVTFGSVLTAKDPSGGYLFRDRLYDVLEGDEEAHYAALEAHIAKHILPFSV